MSKMKELFKNLYQFISRKFGLRQPEPQKQKNVFGHNGELEMIEYGKMVAVIRYHYQTQAKEVGHLDFDEMMFKLSRMTYVEIKALFATILEIQCQTNRTQHLDEKFEETKQNTFKNY
tara:strand:- start:1135 stop:1488 length:354 start_codon:yes stop_codon:yes gene_type:complete